MAVPCTQPGQPQLLLHKQHLTSGLSMSLLRAGNLPPWSQLLSTQVTSVLAVLLSTMVPLVPEGSCSEESLTQFH